MTPDAIKRTDFHLWFDKRSQITLGDLLRHIEKQKIFFVPRYDKFMSRWVITTAYSTGLEVEKSLKEFGVKYTKNDYETDYTDLTGLK